MILCVAAIEIGASALSSAPVRAQVYEHLTQFRSPGLLYSSTWDSQLYLISARPYETEDSIGYEGQIRIRKIRQGREAIDRAAFFVARCVVQNGGTLLGLRPKDRGDYAYFLVDGDTARSESRVLDSRRDQRRDSIAPASQPKAVSDLWRVVCKAHQR
jgi:hypothetical protein